MIPNGSLSIHTFQKNYHTPHKKMNNTSKEFTHIRKNDLPSMVDVSDKSVTERKA